ncbi:MAG: sulfite exporter TauE/SafE family protein [Isosphaeraceae bacterium]
MGGGILGLHRNGGRRDPPAAPRARGGLATKRANATAIFIEAIADWAITMVNLSLGNLRFDILVFSASGVVIGAQIGAICSPYVPDRMLKIAFALSVFAIGMIYVATSLRGILWR